MDYVLVKYDGTYDLIEIEASNLLLFTKDGQPRKELIHAEQQIMNWIDWIESNHSYIEKKLPNLSSPKAFIIIGRNQGFNELEKKLLRRRNKMLFGLTILTYDDLVSNAQLLLNKIISKNHDSRIVE